MNPEPDANLTIICQLINLRSLLKATRFLVALMRELKLVYSQSSYLHSAKFSFICNVISGFLRVFLRDVVSCHLIPIRCLWRTVICYYGLSGPDIHIYLYSRLSFSNSKGLSETLRDIRTSKYQSCRSVENNKLNNHI